ncbi:CpsB/CapC family capsule biosynthesis tyrosine phosphatase [Niabella ginsengisoli]|uniref:protein-tyrosine-phosphatase n=1 Tax=Niabella ginsengisoli TaxID=522298 RepID=A0ABS9SKK6_9BACT|nr:CpsB/CapC family capsule biosynthesis tyrosine phosphatase [Niabella ginsengisoli]MCH5598890.1 hypothetical protein [Niabella ginsengisoli]
MFGLFGKRKNGKCFDATQLKVDMHSHLLPKIDDGSDSVKSSLEMISGLVELGYKQLITTPHIRWDVFRNTRDIIADRLEMIQTELLRNNINVSFWQRQSII